jgi:hypothetical protein
MDFNLVSKNNLGGVVALLLVVVLSQSQFFNFLFDTALGRAILILFILFISYTNKILGVVSVLFIIIMFNNSNNSYIEGNTPRQCKHPSSGDMVDTSNYDVDSSGNCMVKWPKPPTCIDASGKNVDSSDYDDVDLADKCIRKPEKPEKPENPASSGEGFDILGAERTIQSGKQSNSIPPCKSNVDSVMPFDSSFSNLFSVFN